MLREVLSKEESAEEKRILLKEFHKLPLDLQSFCISIAILSTRAHCHNFLVLIRAITSGFLTKEDLKIS